MSRGPGVWQRRLLELLSSGKSYVRLEGTSRSETVAIQRAARTLERKGMCHTALIWGDASDGRRVPRLYAFTLDSPPTASRLRK